MDTTAMKNIIIAVMTLFVAAGVAGLIAYFVIKNQNTSPILPVEATTTVPTTTVSPTTADVGGAPVEKPINVSPPGPTVTTYADYLKMIDGPNRRPATEEEWALISKDLLNPPYNYAPDDIYSYTDYLIEWNKST